MGAPLFLLGALVALIMATPIAAIVLALVAAGFFYYATRLKSVP